MFRLGTAGDVDEIDARGERASVVVAVAHFERIHELARPFTPVRSRSDGDQRASLAKRTARLRERHGSERRWITAQARAPAVHDGGL